MKNLKKILFMSLYTSLLAGCNNKNTDNEDKLNELLNTVTRLESVEESLSEERNNLTEQLSVQQEKNQELENYILELEKQLEQTSIKESDLDLYEKSVLHQNNGEKFHLCYVVRVNENGSPVYSEIGPEFKLIYTDDNKLLVNALDETQVYLRDFETLGRPFYFKQYDPEYGGKDSTEGYCGWVLPVYNGNTYSLYDFDTFAPLLIDCDMSYDFMEYGDIFYSNPLYSDYLEAYDPIYGGHDVQNGGCGFVCQISKDNICYLVDANDFSLILDSSFINHVYAYTDEFGITKAEFNYQYIDEYGCYTGGFATRTAEEIVPYKSDVLIKKKSF